MKHNKYRQHKNRTPASVPRPTSTDGLHPNEIDFTPSSAAVARRAYATYENQGSPAGHEVRHWLAAEQELIAERNLTCTHRFHNQT